MFEMLLLLLLLLPGQWLNRVFVTAVILGFFFHVLLNPVDVNGAM